MGDLREYYAHCAIPKPEARQRVKARTDRKSALSTKDVRGYVFARERNLCRCCRSRDAESLHEIKFKSLGGKVSRKNSIAVCGDGVRGCHGFCQRHEIVVGYSPLGAEGELIFTPETSVAEWMKVKLGEQILSKPMVEMEAE